MRLIIQHLSSTFRNYNFLS